MSQEYRAVENLADRRDTVVRVEADAGTGATSIKIYQDTGHVVLITARTAVSEPSDMLGHLINILQALERDIDLQRRIYESHNDTTGVQDTTPHARDHSPVRQARPLKTEGGRRTP